VVDVADPRYPTPKHERAAQAVVAWFEQRPETQAVLLTNSCARGKATPDSCLDMLVLAPTESVANLDAAWTRHAVASDEIAELATAGRWAELHLDVADGVFVVRPIDHELDWLEVEVGNALSYSVPLLERGERLTQLRTEWLPFYGDDLRAERLVAARATCLGYLERIPWFLDRELWFQALARLQGAFQWFLLALHVSRRTYPIAYDKWIREQVVDNLGLPELYARLPHLFEITRLESRELEEKAADLRALVDTYLFGA
jgi:predicted nucleotidyltransferase